MNDNLVENNDLYYINNNIDNYFNQARISSINLNK